MSSSDVSIWWVEGILEAERAWREPAESVVAYDLYWRSQAQAYKRTSEGLAESIRLAPIALELDPGYGPALARLALSRGMQRQRNWTPPAGPEVEEGIAMEPTVRGIIRALPKGVVPELTALIIEGLRKAGVREG